MRKTTHGNLWDGTKAARRGNFLVANAYVKKEESSQKKKTQKTLTLRLKVLEKEKQSKPKVIRRKEILEQRSIK